MRRKRITKHLEVPVDHLRAALVAAPVDRHHAVVLVDRHRDVEAEAQAGHHRVEEAVVLVGSGRVAVLVARDRVEEVEVAFS